jgi:hypothetical protein
MRPMLSRFLLLLLAAPLALGAQQVRVRTPVQDSAALRAVTEGNIAEVLRVVNELRARESRILRQLEGLPPGNREQRRPLELELASVSRDAFTVMSLIESRCLDQRATTPNGYLGLNITTEVEVDSGTVTVQRSMVASLEPGSPAEAAGIAPGDRLLSVAGRDTRERFPDLKGVLEPGRRVAVRVERDGREREFSMTVAQRPQRFDAGCPQFERALQPLRMGGVARVWVQDSTDAQGNRRMYVLSPSVAPTPPTPPTAAAPRATPTPPAPPARGSVPVPGAQATPPTPAAAPPAPSVFVFGSTSGGSSFSYFAGAQFRQLDDDWRSVLGIRAGTEGVLVNEVAPGSAAAQSGLKVGDVVTMVGNTPATSPLVVSRLLGLTEGSQATLRVVRGRESRTVTLRWSGGGGR